MQPLDGINPWTDFSAQDWIGLGVALLMQLILWGWIVVLIVLDRRAFRQYWKPALWTAAVVTLLALPVAAVTVLLAEAPSDSPLPGLVRIGFVIGAAIRVTITAAWVWAVYVVARYEWAHRRERALARADGWLLGAGVGLVLGVLSAVMLYGLGVREGPVMLLMMENLGAINELPGPALFAWSALFVTYVAVLEELQFRGALFGFLLRVWGGGTAAVVGTHAIVGVIFALMHIPNTTSPVLKCSQIMVLAIVTGELARRRSVAAAVACHVAMNIVAVAVELAIPMQ